MRIKITRADPPVMIDGQAVEAGAFVEVGDDLAVALVGHGCAEISADVEDPTEDPPGPETAAVAPAETADAPPAGRRRGRPRK